MNNTITTIRIVTNSIIIILLVKIIIELSSLNNMIERYGPILDRGKSFLENILKEDDKKFELEALGNTSEDIPTEDITNLSDFEKVLKKIGYSYYMEGSYLIINHNESVIFYTAKLPSNVKFNNEGDVVLSSLEKLSPYIQFNNKGNVYLNVVTEINNNVQFNNEGYIYLQALIKLSNDVQFNNKGSIILDKLVEFPQKFKFENKGILFLYSLKELPKNKYEIFKNDGLVYYNGVNGEEFDPRIK